MYLVHRGVKCIWYTGGLNVSGTQGVKCIWYTGGLNVSG